MGIVLYLFHKKCYLCAKSINLRIQLFLEYVIVKKMSLDLILGTELELRRMYSFAMWTCVFSINPMHVVTNGHYAVLAATGINGRETLESLRCC